MHRPIECGSEFNDHRGGEDDELYMADEAGRVLLRDFRGWNDAKATVFHALWVSITGLSSFAVTGQPFLLLGCNRVCEYALLPMRWIFH
jgi:hypothetical protein